MNNDSTRPASLEVMRDALALLHEYSVQFPELPQPHVTFYRVHVPGWAPRVELQVHVEDFEAWREALAFEPAAVALQHINERQTNVQVDGTVTMGVGDRVVEVRVHLYAPGLPFSPERPASEQVTA